MELRAVTKNVETTGDFARSTFKIATNRKAFEVLSSGLYPDKIRAVIRELSTNAADAHIAAGHNRPFEVHLPNTMEPYFSVKDWGTGMTPEEIDTLYTTYFASNRAKSNKFTGCLGLGSKSPFAYVEQFTVISRQNDVATTYNCHVNADGMPCVAKVGEQPDTDGDGVEVRLPAAERDFTEFNNKANMVLQWFNPRPNVVGSANFAWVTLDCLHVTDRYRLHKFAGQSGSHVIMGNVAYDFNANDISADGLVDSVARWGIDFNVDVGSVEITASREKLSYDPATVKYLQTTLAGIVEELKVHANTFLDKANTIWEARCLLYSYRNTLIGNLMAEDAKWMGKRITAQVTLSNYSDVPEANLLTVGRRGKDGGLNYRRSSCFRITPDDTPIYVNDVERGGLGRIAEHLHAQNKGDVCYVLGSTPALFTDEQKQAMANFGEDDEGVDETAKGKPSLELSGVYEKAILASTLPPPPKRQGMGAGGGNSYTRLMKLVPASTGDWRGNWKNEKVDISVPGVFVVMIRFGIIRGGQYDLSRERTWSAQDSMSRAPDHYAEVLEAMAKMGDKTPVYGVRPRDDKRITDLGWQTLREHVTESVAAMTKAMKPRVKDACQYVAVSTSLATLYRFRGQLFAGNSPFGKLVERYLYCRKEYESPAVQGYTRLTKWLDIELANAKDDESLYTEWTDVKSRYPMLKFWSFNDTTPKAIAAVSDYIQSVDRARKPRAKKVTNAETVCA